MTACCLALDVGGTFIKLGLMDSNCVPACEGIAQTPVDSTGDAAAILGAFDRALCMGLSIASARGASVDRVSISIPGPFDYGCGVSHMRHKFAAIENLPLPARLSQTIGDLPFTFLHDATAFMLGECFFGAGIGAARPVGVMLGTGFGFAVLQDGKVCVSAQQTPALSLWAKPFRDGITESFVSRQAIRARYQRLRPGAANLDVHEIAALARQGDEPAKETMKETGALLAEVLQPHLTNLHCDRIILGGQVARSLNLLSPGFPASFAAMARAAMHLDDAALRGAALYAMRERSSLVRETTEADMISRLITYEKRLTQGGDSA